MSIQFRTVHKKKDARPYVSDQHSIGDQRIDYLYHCGICGMTVDIRKQTPGDGEGYAFSTDADGNTILVNRGGCWFCHSRNWI